MTLPGFVDCPTCGGSGRWDACPDCVAGQVPSPETVEAATRGAVSEEAWSHKADSFRPIPVNRWHKLKEMAAAARRVADAPEVWWCRVHQRTAPPLIDGSKNCRSADDTPCRMVRRLLVDPGDDT